MQMCIYGLNMMSGLWTVQLREDQLIMFETRAVCVYVRIELKTNSDACIIDECVYMLSITLFEAYIVHIYISITFQTVFGGHREDAQGDFRRRFFSLKHISIAITRAQNQHTN